MSVRPSVVVSLLHKKFYLIIIMEHRLYYWKISCNIGRQIVVSEDQLYYWKSTVLLEDLLWCWKMNGRSKVLLENQLYWRQSPGLDGNYRSRRITARRWLHKYVGAECGASSFTWYLYQMCNTDVRQSREVSGHLPEIAWREWPEILHADVSWPSPELISLWPWSVDFSNFGTILT